MVHSALQKGRSSRLLRAGSEHEQTSGQSHPRISFAVEPLTIGASSDLEEDYDDAAGDGATSPSSDGHSLSHGTTPKTPFTAHKKWDAVMQRLHHNQQQIVRRRPGKMVGFASEDSPGDSPDGEQDRGFHKWKTLKERLKEVKQDLNPDRSGSDDGSSLLGGETMSMVEAQLVELLAEPAGEAEAAGDSRGGRDSREEGNNGSSGSRYGSRGLNVTVYRFRGSTLPLSEQQALSEQQQPQQAPVQASPFAAVAATGRRATNDLQGDGRDSNTDSRDARESRDSRDGREARGSNDAQASAAVFAGARRSSLQRSQNLDPPSSSFTPASAGTTPALNPNIGCAPAANVQFVREGSGGLSSSLRSNIARATQAGMDRIQGIPRSTNSILEQPSQLQPPQLQPSEPQPTQRQRSLHSGMHSLAELQARDPAVAAAVAPAAAASDGDRVERGRLHASSSSHALQEHQSHGRMASSSGNSSLNSGSMKSPSVAQPHQGLGPSEPAGSGFNRGNLALSPELLPASRFPQHSSMQGSGNAEPASTPSPFAQAPGTTRLSGAAGSGTAAVQGDAYAAGPSTNAALQRSPSAAGPKRPSLFIPVGNGDSPRGAGPHAGSHAAAQGQASTSYVPSQGQMHTLYTAGAAGVAGVAGAPRSAMLQSLRLRVALPNGTDPNSPAVADSPLHHSTPSSSATTAATATATAAAAATASPAYGTATPDAAGRGADGVARTPRPSLLEANSRVLASFKLPAAMYANQEDILNDSDIQDLLQLVAKSCGATAGAASHVHWHMPQTPMGNDVADTYRTSTIYSPGVSTTGAMDGPPATASRGRSSGGTELHVHVDQQQDGRLSVIISGTEDAVDPMGHMDRVTLMEPGLQGGRRDGSHRQFGSQVGMSQGLSHGHRASGLSVTHADDTNSTSSGSRAGRGGEGYHSPMPAASPSPQWQAPPDNRPVSDDGCSEVASDLSAMGNPMAYSARLCSRLEQHAVPHSSHPASPSGAAEQLERYLDTNQALKQKAGKLQATFARRQQEDSVHQDPGPSFFSRSFSRKVAASVHTALSPRATAPLNRTSLAERFSSGKGLGRLGGASAAAGGLLGSLRSSAPEFSTAAAGDDDDKLNVEQLKREMERHLMRTS